MTVPLRQLLVHLDGGARNVPRLQAARELARVHDCAVTALYAVTPSYVETAADDLSPASVLGILGVNEAPKERARKAFEVEMRSPGPAVAWSEATDFPAAAGFAQQALYADLVVLGQREPGQSRRELPADFNESVIIASGKPALVVPHIGWPGAIGDTIVIAWKETREAARAVTAALPLLRRARQVHVLGWAAEAPAAVHGIRLDLHGFLRAHGVSAVLHDGGTEPAAVGDMLLSRAFDLEADLLVMGCYGHSRGRELVLGGATRTILGSMTLPVLMAH